MNIYNFTKKKIISILNKNFKNIAGDIASSITCEQPKNQSFGDISTNVVMLILKKIKQDKKNISNTFIKHMLANKEFKKVEFVEPPGICQDLVKFSNLWYYNDCDEHKKITPNYNINTYKSRSEIPEKVKKPNYETLLYYFWE